MTPSVRAAAAGGINGSDDIATVHVERTLDMIIRRPSALSAAVAAGACGVVGMTYRLADGRVTVVGTQHAGLGRH
jgi:carbonic anhydrase